MNTLKLVAAAGFALLATACMHTGPMSRGSPGGTGPDHQAHQERVDAEYWQIDPCARSDSPAPAQAHANPHADGMRCLDGLDLGSEQRSRITQIRDEMVREHREQMAEMRAHRTAGMGTPPAATSEQDQRRAYDEAAAVRKRMFESRLEARKRMLDVLTPAQRERFERDCPEGRAARWR